MPARALDLTPKYPKLVTQPQHLGAKLGVSATADDQDLGPGLAIPPRALCRLDALEGLDARLAVVDTTIGLIARELVARCRELTLRSSQLEREITQLASRLAPTLLALSGCGGLSAAKIVGETAGVGRF